MEATTIALRAGFNSRTPGGVRPNLDRLKQMTPIVSIHAPREGCDCWRSRAADALYVVSIHAPREGCDLSLLLEGELTSGFQFTHPGRGATLRSIPVVDGIEVSIHAPREGCDASSDLARVLSEVSIHAPREGCDDISEVITTAQTVSIHAPREGCDLSVKDLALRILMFQFTHPGRGATCQRRGRYSSSQRRFNSRTPGGVRLTA